MLRIPEWRILTRHALRNALLPMITVAGLQFPTLLGGALVTETVFTWPGMGRLFLDSIGYRDYPVLSQSGSAAAATGATYTRTVAVEFRTATFDLTVVNKAEGRSTLELFCHYYKLKNSDLKAHVVIGDNQQGIKTVAGNPDSVGYVSIGTAEYEAGHGSAIKLLPCSGVAASIDNVKNKTFPLSRPLNLVTRKAPEGLAKEFIAFAQSEKVHDIVKEQYFVPVAR